MIETIFLCSICFFFIFISFFLGLHYGSKIRNNETINIPNFNPISVIETHKREKEKQQKQEREMLIEEINLANIDSYDGTGLGQKDIPDRR